MNRWIRYSLATGASIALGAGAGVGAWAQAQSAPATAPTTTPAQATPGSTPQATPRATESPATGAASGEQAAQPHATLQLVQTQAQLGKSLDAKKVKQGDAVTAKLLENVEIPNAQALPKNTVLEGHVDAVTASENKSDSTVTVTFDKAKLKDGQELPIKATVVSISEPASMAAQQSGAMSSGGGGMMPGGGGMAAGGGAPAGGGAGSGSQASAGSGSSAGGSSQQSPASMPQGTGDMPQSGNAPIPDVTLTSNIHQHSSATFMSKGRNVHVPDGTQMDVAIAVIPAGVRVP
jgi:hypothetical protein